MFSYAFGKRVYDTKKYFYSIDDDAKVEILKTLHSCFYYLLAIGYADQRHEELKRVKHDPNIKDILGFNYTPDPNTIEIKNIFDCFKDTLFDLSELNFTDQNDNEPIDLSSVEFINTFNDVPHTIVHGGMADTVDNRYLYVSNNEMYFYVIYDYDYNTNQNVITCQVFDQDHQDIVQGFFIKNKFNTLYDEASHNLNLEQPCYFDCVVNGLDKLMNFFIERNKNK